MAKEFPHVEVVGVDLAPSPVDPDNIPANCRFEVADMNLDLSRFHDQFDIIHARCVAAGVSRKSFSMHRC